MLDFKIFIKGGNVRYRNGVIEIVKKIEPECELDWRSKIIQWNTFCDTKVSPICNIFWSQLSPDKYSAALNTEIEQSVLPNLSESSFNMLAASSLYSQPRC